MFGSTGATRYAVFPRFIDPEKRIGYPVDTDAPLFAHEAFVTRVLGERKGTGREMMPSLQRGPAESILIPAQIDGPSSHVCLGLTALTYVSTLFSLVPVPFCTARECFISSTFSFFFPDILKCSVLFFFLFYADSALWRIKILFVINFSKV